MSPHSRSRVNRAAWRSRVPRGSLNLRAPGRASPTSNSFVVVSIVALVLPDTVVSVRIVLMRRSVTPGEVGAWCWDGRWGPRRVRTAECWATLVAEEVYDFLCRDALLIMRAGARGELTWRVGDRILLVKWELRANRVWRFGRAFLRCPVCGRLATRLYLPTVDVRSPACRSYWGLSYQSRQQNYRDDVGLLRQLGLSARAFARRETGLRRECSRQAARARVERRRELLRRLAAPRLIPRRYRRPTPGVQPEHTPWRGGA